MQFEYKIEQIITDRNINESDQLVKVANITSTLIFRTLQYSSPEKMDTFTPTWS